MAKKKITPKEEYMKIGQEYADGYSKCPVPEGATYFELEIDTSSCYYQGDTPSYIVHFFKKNEEK